MGDSVFKPLIQGPQKSAGEKPNRIRRSQIEWTSADSINRFFQEFAHFSNAFQGLMWEIACVSVPAAILLPTSPTEFCQFFRMSMAKAQSFLYDGSLARITSLCLSLALLSAVTFQSFLRLRPHRGTPVVDYSHTDAD